MDYSGHAPAGYVPMNYRNSSNGPVVCYSYSMISTSTIWKGQNPLDFSYPLFLLDLLIIILTSRATAIVLQPFRQPRYIAELLGGIILGPTVLGRVSTFTTMVFPLRSVLVLETLAYLGVVYFIFIVAVELDLSVVQRNPARSAAFASVSVILPFTIGASYGVIIHPELNQGVDRSAFLTFLGVTLSVTAFSVLARTLAELKLLHTGVGITALSSAVLVDALAWGLLAVAITLAQNGGRVSAIVWTVISGVVFMGSCVTIVRPAVVWVASKAEEREEVDDFHACVILVGVLVAAVAADAIGIHAVSGAFLFGLVIPNGPLGSALIERVEDFVEGMLLPLFFAISGLRTNLGAIHDTEGAVFLILVVVASVLAKVAGCILLGYLNKMPLRDGLLIGLLMNTKGIMEMVMLNIGMDKQVLSESTFTILVFMSVTVTALLTPLLRMVVKQPGRRVAPHRRRTVQWPNPESELRMLVCVHGTRNVSTMIGLIEASNPTKRAPILVHALHLIQLTGRASAMLILHNTTASASKAGSSSGVGALRSNSEHIMHAFDIYEQHAAGVNVQCLTAVSPYATMHQDVCSIAVDKHIALIILPFHKQQTVDGGMEVTNPALRALNHSVLDSAPCSVGILIDRGLGGAIRISAGPHAAHHVALVFLGGPDDREALSYAARMAEHPGISLTVLRLAPPQPTSRSSMGNSREGVGRQDREHQLDAECISDFRLRNVSDESVVYDERVASNSEETMAAIRSMDSIHDLFIVGRGLGVESPLTAGLNEWSECPELGPIGDVLATVDFAGTASVLIVQRCPTAVIPPRVTDPDSPGKKMMKVSPSKVNVGMGN